MDMETVSGCPFVLHFLLDASFSPLLGLVTGFFLYPLLSPWCILLGLEVTVSNSVYRLGHVRIGKYSIQLFLHDSLNWKTYFPIFHSPHMCVYVCVCTVVWKVRAYNPLAEQDASWHVKWLKAKVIDSKKTKGKCY